MIRQATLADLEDTQLYVLAHKFYTESNIPGDFVPSIFRANWQELIKTGHGVIFLLCDNGKILGAIGGVLYPDICDGKKVVQEMFWFVTPLARGKVTALRLYDALETWAKSNTAARLHMSCIGNTHTAQVRKFYERKGFKPKEINFFKIL